MTDLHGQNCLTIYDCLFNRETLHQLSFFQKKLAPLRMPQRLKY